MCICLKIIYLFYICLIGLLKERIVEKILFFKKKGFGFTFAHPFHLVVSICDDGFYTKIDDNIYVEEDTSTQGEMSK